VNNSSDDFYVTAVVENFGKCLFVLKIKVGPPVSFIVILFVWLRSKSLHLKVAILFLEAIPGRKDAKTVRASSCA